MSKSRNEGQRYHAPGFLPSFAICPSIIPSLLVVRRSAFLLLLLTFFATAAAQGPVDRKHSETLLAPFPPEVRDSAIVSPDGRRIAYISQVGRQQVVVVDGKQETPYDQVGSLTFSPNSQWRAYAAAAGGTWSVVINGRPQPAQQRVGPPVFSPNSKRLAYTALQPDGQHVAVIEATKPPGKPYGRIFEGRLVFSPDGQRLAYGAQSDGGVVRGRRG